MGRSVAIVAAVLWAVALAGMFGLLGCATTKVQTWGCEIERTTVLRWGEYEIEGCGVTVSGLDRPISPDLKDLGIEGLVVTGALVGAALAGPPGAAGGAALGGAMGAVGEVLDE